MNDHAWQALEEALAALRWIESNADVPADFPNQHIRLRQIHARAAEALASAIPPEDDGA
jgi:hypothetical protein